MLDLGPATLAVVDDDRPVTLSVGITDATFTYTPLKGDAAGPVSTYGPVTGTLQLSGGKGGAAPVVLLDGKPLAPVKPPPGPPPAGPGSGAPPGGTPATPAAPARFASWAARSCAGA